MLTQKEEIWLNDFSAYSTLNNKIHVVFIFVENIHKIAEFTLLSN